jgi:hypothetical protein
VWPTVPIPACLPQPLLTDTRVVRKILDHLRIPADLPMLAPARCPFDEPMLFRAPAPDPPFILDDDQTWTARGPP